MKKLLLFIAIAALLPNAYAQTTKTKNLIVVTLDGMRWQEVFRGADSAMISAKYTSDKDVVRKKYWAASAEERRKILFPFLWSVVSKQGQIYGNRDLGNKDELSNPYHFSYPGYNEIFTGFPDARMNTNDAVNNPNTNVLEYINKQKGFEGKVIAFSSWERFPQIFNVLRSGLPVYSGYADLKNTDANARLKYLNELQRNVPRYLGDSTRSDFLTFEYSKEYIKQYKPRVLYMAFDETDDMAHEGNYKSYLERAKQEDGFIRALWDMVQADPFYKNNTTLLITCDHGRGNEPMDKWRDHGADVKGSENTWFAVIGPDTKPMGEIKTQTTTYHKQLAQTMAKLLGLDFKANAGHEVGDAILTVIK
ncbi:alkaline phosphatase family protein [Mucilaginibacter glaciei]|uniref:Alkaline phosphatase family protein n=1 Tax=Mucilaginibacter glaciei TaxID=2772109 RepID=A0A926RZ79_9SPHI|nr:alkaline phosphatase family protein [Mucilaginibacter glaciei]MBD1391585.1 alkaline phosphatase family protein [Mucilaginibacter glaciei]